MENAKISPQELTIVGLNRGLNLDSFDCDDADLNDFLKNDAFSHEEKNIVKTYVCLYQNNPVAFFSVCTDAIKLSKTEREEEFGQPKTYPDYPAIKIARLAVAKDFQRRGMGSFMVNIVIGKGIELSKSIGCRFVTVDAYQKQADFYKKMGFVQNLEDRSGDNVSMRFDIQEAVKV